MLATNRRTNDGPKLIQQAQHWLARWSTPAAASSLAIRLILISLKSAASSLLMPSLLCTSEHRRDNRTPWQDCRRLKYIRRLICQHWRARDTSARLQGAIFHRFHTSNPSHGNRQASDHRRPLSADRSDNFSQGTILATSANNGLLNGGQDSAFKLAAGPDDVQSMI